MEDEHQGQILRAMDPERAADVLEEMEPDEAVDALQSVTSEEAADLLRRMDREEASDVQELLGYPEDTAGGIMTTDYISVPDWATVSKVVAALRARARLAAAGQEDPLPEGLLDIYVVAPDGGSPAPPLPAPTAGRGSAGQQGRVAGRRPRRWLSPSWTWKRRGGWWARSRCVTYCWPTQRRC